MDTTKPSDRSSSHFPVPFLHAGYLQGGIEAWRAAGLPLSAKATGNGEDPGVGTVGCRDAGTDTDEQTRGQAT